MPTTMPRVFAVVAVSAVAVSGCAGNQYSKDVSRLRSDVTLLSERVSQIERSGPTASASSTAWTDPLLTPMDSTSTKPRPTASTSSKPAKKDIQLALKNAGFYDGTVDGKIGPRSREAIKEFQRINGLKVDGVVGRQTWDKLSPYLDLSGTADLSTIPDAAMK
jgi:murein L,D-transpeptidase YcbB/YkuD